MRTSEHAGALLAAYPDANFSLGRIIDEFVVAACAANVPIEMGRTNGGQGDPEQADDEEDISSGPITKAFDRILLSHACPHCGHQFQRTGAWFKAADQYRCEPCRQEVRLTYRDKVKLFRDHSALAKGSGVLDAFSSPSTRLGVGR